MNRSLTLVSYSGVRYGRSALMLALARINVGYICLKKGIFGEAIEHLSKAIRLDNDRKATLYAHYYLGLVYQEREMYDDAQTFCSSSALRTVSAIRT